MIIIELEIHLWIDEVRVPVLCRISGSGVEHIYPENFDLKKPAESVPDD
jgi:hypothetical protein